MTYGYKEIIIISKLILSVPLLIPFTHPFIILHIISSHSVSLSQPTHLLLLLLRLVNGRLMAVQILYVFSHPASGSHKVYPHSFLMSTLDGGVE